jgi:hypothetical protein
MREDEDEDDEDEELYGPQLPGQVASSRSRPGRRPGPTIPTTQDLELRRGELVNGYICTKPYIMYLCITLLKQFPSPTRIRPLRR